jgi:hypothetical protein
MYAQPLMRFDQDTQSWRTSLDTSLWDLPMSSPTLPQSGLMRNGVLFERPMLERPTSATDSSSLPTPRAQVRQDIYDREDYHYNLEEALATLPTPMTDSGRQSGECRDFGGDLLHGVTCENCKVVTLPTPTARDHKDQSFSPRVLDGRSHGELPEIVGRNFLPTPAVNDMGAGKDPEQFEQWRLRQKSADGRTAVHGKSLYQEALKTEIAWGKYEPAIRRWEALTREVPEPTVPHKDKRRLNPAFVEWMMGLPAGHVTGHGLSAAKELKMLGNGVVPQQARSAVTQLMERITQ